MKTKNFLIALLCLIANYSFSQIKTLGFRASYMPHSTVLSPTRYNGDDFKASSSFSGGLIYSKYREQDWFGDVDEDGSFGLPGLTCISFGLNYRQINIQSSSSSTNFQFKFIELPIEWSVFAPLFKVFTIGIDAGVSLSVPLEYKGSIYRYQQPNYTYGTERYEKPGIILGAKMGPNVGLILKKVHIVFFASYGLNLIPIGAGAPEDEPAPFKTPVPVYFEFGTRILMGKNLQW